MILLSHIENAIQSIKSNRLRSILTATGVTIAIASITAILSLGAGARDIVASQVDSLGGTIAIVKPGAKNESISKNINKITNPQYSASTITKNDLETIKSTKYVSAAAPLMTLQGAVSGEFKSSEGTSIVATTPELQDVNQLKVRDGQFIDTSLVDTTAVIGNKLAIELYGTEQVIGKTVSIRGQDFTIIGLLERINEPININMIDFDRSVFINFESGILQNQGTAHIQQINLKVDSVANITPVITNINKSILKNHLGQADFSVLSGTEISQQSSGLFQIITGVSVAIAAISLIVGGVGIMNIMLVNVSERTREIGIRKAMGATNGSIVWQFIIESLALSLLGGIAGYAIGYSIAFIISLMLTFSPLFTWEIAVTAVSISLITGTLFGAYPAIKAAKKDPISALRLYN